MKPVKVFQGATGYGFRGCCCCLRVRLWVLFAVISNSYFLSIDETLSELQHVLSLFPNHCTVEGGGGGSIRAENWKTKTYEPALYDRTQKSKKN